jgi:hypothetical protein
MPKRLYCWLLVFWSLTFSVLVADLCLVFIKIQSHDTLYHVSLIIVCGH